MDNNGFASRSAGVNARDLLYDEFKAKKIVLLEYKYNILLTVLFNINSSSKETKQSLSLSNFK